jgi:magnesium transporter
METSVVDASPGDQSVPRPVRYLQTVRHIICRPGSSLILRAPTLPRVCDVIVEHGVIRSRYSSTASVDEALAHAADGDCVAWIGALEPSPDDVAAVARRLGLGERVGLEIGQRRKLPRVPRARIAVLQSGVHVVMVGADTGGADGPRLVGALELLATPECVAVFASGLPEQMQPSAIRKRLEPSLARASTLNGGFVFGLVIAQVLDWYDELLDEIEDEVIRIANEVFVRRGSDQLKRIYALSRPVHATAVAVQPLLYGWDELAPSAGVDVEFPLAHQLRSEVAYLTRRLERIDALLSSAQQSYFSLTQGDANRLIEQQANTTRKLSGYALLIAIPTIVFSLYGTNFHHVPLIGKSWGYWVMLGVTVVVCLFAWWRLRKAGWL